MRNATAITTGSANQRPNTPCIRLWIDVTFRGLEDSYIACMLTYLSCMLTCRKKNLHLGGKNMLSFPFL